MSEDAEQPRRKIAHVVGAPLEALSIVDLEKRVTLLRQKIERLERAKHLKRIAREQAGSVFKSRVSLRDRRAARRTVLCQPWTGRETTFHAAPAAGTV